MDYVILQKFIQLISTHTGLHVREQDQKDFSQKIFSRMKHLKLHKPEQYYQILSSTQTDLAEWRELVLLLTIGETYFFRDRGQVELLKSKILPQLIEIKRKKYNATKEQLTLRIWSAGCSSGEEPYSLAILIKELIHDLNKWNIFILGTDINPVSIEKAKQGIYDAWSFRQVNPTLQKQYFYQQKTRWEVNEQIRKMVKFRCSNFFQEQFPGSMSDIHNMDIIICRNVFIYFKSQAIATSVEKFYHALNPGGYLIVGHTELQGQNIFKLQPKVFPESVVYQRNQDLQIEPLPSYSSQPKWTEEKPGLHNNTIKSKFSLDNLINTQSISSLQEPVSKPPSKELTDLSLAETLFHSGDYLGAIQAAKQIAAQHPNHFDAYYLIAQASANLGDYEQAIYWCQQALKINDLSEKPYYILAHIAIKKIDFDAAKNLFKKIIYLAPSSIAAYLELSFIYEQEGNRDRAKKMQKTALELLKKLPHNVAIEPLNQITAAELILQVEKLL